MKTMMNDPSGELSLIIEVSDERNGMQDESMAVMRYDEL